MSNCGYISNFEIYQAKNKTYINSYDTIRIQAEHKNSSTKLQKEEKIDEAYIDDWLAQKQQLNV